MCVDTHIVDELDDDRLGRAVEALKLLADETRFKIVWSLVHGEHSVGQLAEHVGATSPAVSQHLARLRLAGMVRTRREGNKIFYSAENPHLLDLVSQVVSHTEHLRRV